MEERTTMTKVNAAQIAEVMLQFPDPKEAFEEIRKRFPNAPVAVVDRAMKITLHELRERAAKSFRESESIKRVGSVFDGLEGQGLTLRQAAEIKAAQGDPIAISLLAKVNSREWRLGGALWRAACEAHPDWEAVGDGSFRFTGKDQPQEPDELVDWFQLTHPRKARAVEAAIETRLG
jgi:hypothetical protein